MQRVKRATIGQKVQADVIGNGTWVYGPITEFDKDTITFDPNDGQGAVKMPRAEVYKFEVRRAVRPEPEIAAEIAASSSESVTLSDLDPDDLEDLDEEVAIDETLIRPEHEKYTSYTEIPTASGRPSYDSGDSIAELLRGLSLDEVYIYTARILLSAGTESIGRGKRKITVSESALRNRYQHLNPGMQRMNLGNLARGAANITGSHELEEE